MYRVRLPIADMKQGIKNGRYGYPKSKENNMKSSLIKQFWKEIREESKPLVIEETDKFDSFIENLFADQRERKTEVYTVLGGTK
jgi:hypothetical protein